MTRVIPRETRDEFIARIGREAKLTADELLRVVDVVPCDCGFTFCPGWKVERKRRGPDDFDPG